MSTHNHPIAAEELMAYLDGELGPAEATAAGTHLEDCVECQRLAAGLRNVSQAVKSWKVFTPGSSAMPQAIVAALNAQSAERVPVPAIPMPWYRRIQPALAASAAIAAVIVGLVTLIGRNANTAYSEVGSATRDDTSRAIRASHISPAIVGATVPPSASKDDFQIQRSISVPGQYLNDKDVAEGSGGGGGDRDELRSSAKGGMSTALTGPMIIRTAGLSLITKDFDKARTQVEEIMHRRRGYVGTLKVTGAAQGGRSLTASLRIPAAQLDSTLAELKTLGRLDSESQNGEDVTSQYVDLNARLDNSRHTEQRLTDLLQNRTGKLSDVLSVENELARVRGEIESMEAERKTMANQVDFATINLTITEDYRAQLQVVPPSTSTRLSNAAVEGYRNLTDGLMSVALFFLESGPSLLLWVAILFFPARFAWRKLRHSFSGASV
jgi:negative regulator of sigma E activity